MRTDYRFQPPTPSSAVTMWLDKRYPSGKLIDLDALEKMGDAPKSVLVFAREFIAARTEWEQGAKDRPFTYHPGGMGMKLFNGPWQSHRTLHTSWEVVEAEFPVEGEPDACERFSAAVAATYQTLAAADDETGCRKLAAAIHERMDKIAQADRTLVSLALELDSGYTGRRPTV